MHTLIPRYQAEVQSLSPHLSMSSKTTIKPPYRDSRRHGKTLTTTHVIYLLRPMSTPDLAGNMHTCTFRLVWWHPPLGSDKTNLDHTFFILTHSIFPSKITYKNLCSNTNTITRGFIGRGRFSFSRRKYIRHVLAANVVSPSFPRGTHGKVVVNITFSNEDAIRFNPHNNDPLIITIQYGN